MKLGYKAYIEEFYKDKKPKETKKATKKAKKSKQGGYKK